MAMALWGVMPLWIESSAADYALRELIAGHVRSLMVDHLTDVTSSDSHTVKPWFEGKLDFSPLVPDLSAQGFRFVGGRLEYLDQRSVAALVYQRRAHVINLFMWPAQPEVGGNETMVTRQGYHLVHWQEAGELLGGFEPEPERATRVCPGRASADLGLAKLIAPSTQQLRGGLCCKNPYIVARHVPGCSVSYLPPDHLIPDSAAAPECHKVTGVLLFPRGGQRAIRVGGKRRCWLESGNWPW